MHLSFICPIPTWEKAPGRIEESPVFAKESELRRGRGGKLELERVGKEEEER